MLPSEDSVPNLSELSLLKYLPYTHCHSRFFTAISNFTPFPLWFLENHTLFCFGLDFTSFGNFKLKSQQFNADYICCYLFFFIIGSSLEIIVGIVGSIAMLNINSNFILYSCVCVHVFNLFRITQIPF